MDELSRLIAEAARREAAEGFASKPSVPNYPAKKADITFGKSEKASTFTKPKSLPKVSILDEEDYRESEERVMDYTRVRQEIKSNYKPRKGRGLSFKRPTVILN